MRKNNLLIKYIIAVLIIAALFILSICVGSVAISPKEIFDILFMGKGDAVNRDIVLNIRFPRALAAFFAGGALALSGYSLQTFFRNPIAGPFILGISSGAKLMVALLLVFAAGRLHGLYFSMILAAFIGALISMGFVLLCSKRVNNMALLLVCGVMIGYICTAITDFVVTFADDADIVNLHNWSRGSLSGMGWSQTMVLSLLILVAGLMLLLLSKPMGAYQMGEGYAKSLGVNIKLFRAMLVLLSSLLAATVTAFIGPVSFVGIAVPHISRGCFKETAPKRLLPACFILGGAFTLGCDFIARMVFSPTELSISTVTAVFGAPVVIYLLIKNKMGRL